MRIKSGYVLRQVAQSWIVLPLAEETVNFTGVLQLNDSGAMLWKALEQGADCEDLAGILTSEYNVSAEQASADALEFMQKLLQAGCAEPDETGR